MPGPGPSLTLDHHALGSRRALAVVVRTGWVLVGWCSDDRQRQTRPGWGLKKSLDNALGPGSILRVALSPMVVAVPTDACSIPYHCHRDVGERPRLETKPFLLGYRACIRSC